MKVYAWLIDFAHFRRNCPTGIIPEWMQKVTQHNGITQCVDDESRLFSVHRPPVGRKMKFLSERGNFSEIFLFSKEKTNFFTFFISTAQIWENALLILWDWFRKYRGTKWGCSLLFPPNFDWLAVEVTRGVVTKLFHRFQGCKWEKSSMAAIKSSATPDKASSVMWSELVTPPEARTIIRLPSKSFETTKWCELDLASQFFPGQFSPVSFSRSFFLIRSSVFFQGIKPDSGSWNFYGNSTTPIGRTSFTWCVCTAVSSTRSICVWCARLSGTRQNGTHTVLASLGFHSVMVWFWVLVFSMNLREVLERFIFPCF